MNSWQECDLSSLISEIQSGGRPKGGASERTGNVPSLGGENIRQSGGLNLEGVKRIPEQFFAHMSKGILQTKDVLINKDGANTGKVAIYEGQFVRASINEHVFLIRGRKEKLDQKYLYYLLLSDTGQNTIRCKITGSAQPGLKYNFVENFPVSVPLNIQEQVCIAEGLATADRAILQTEALIAKHKRVRIGLMQDLLSRGMDEKGKLRDLPQCDSPSAGSKFLYSGWKILPLSQAAQVSSGVTLGRKVSGPDAVTLPYLRVFNVQDSYVDLSDVKTVTVRKGEVARYKLEKGDVLMNEGGDFDKLGRGTVWEGQIEPCLHQNHVFRVRTDRTQLLPEFLALISASPYGKRFFVLSSKQSTNLASINSTQLKGFPVPCPEPAEQQRILDVFAAHDDTLRREQAQLAKLNRLRVGLMQDLLTGRVSVTPLLSYAEAAGDSAETFAPVASASAP